MNTITIKGRLTADAIVKNDTASGKVVTFTLADTLFRDGKPVKDADGKDVVQFVDCASKGKAADHAETLKKGNFVNGIGRLKVTRVSKDGRYYVNSTVWINTFNEKPAAEAEAAEA